MMPYRNLKRYFRKALTQPLYAARVLVARLRATMYYYWGKGKSSFPEAITLFLTHRCNLRCKMCGQWGEAGVTKRESQEFIRRELSLPQLKAIIDAVSSFLPNITLFGGEPLLHTGCIELIRYITQKRMHCLMITNGSMLKEHASEIVRAGLDELNISLDGNSSLHDEIRGMPGLFERIMAGIKEINRYKQELATKKPFINLQCTINAKNYLRLPEMLEVAREAHAASLTFHNLIFLDSRTVEKQKEYDRLLGCSSAEWEGFVFAPGMDPEKLYAQMQGIMAGTYEFGVDFYPNFSKKPFFEYYTNPCYVPSDYPLRCLSPWIVAYIFPDGDLRPCLNCSYSFGNVLQEQFSRVWNSPKAVTYRTILKEKGMFPVCIRCTELYRY
ncbi:MAG: radical SAM protein [Candidatus Omnitrophica bacterium]|nr:radical SAM protein [Candidatus Omnitrophota bacterium]